MLKHRFVLAAAFAAVAFAAAPAFASPAHDSNQAPVAMSGARQPDREAPVVVEHPERTQVAPIREQATPVVAPIVTRAGFANVALPPIATAGFGVQVARDAIGFRAGFATGDAATADHAKFGFAAR
jgi:hypothetical protein